MSKFSNSVIFALGAAVGSIATWQYVKKMYERIAQEEIDSVKEVFANRESEGEPHKDNVRTTAEQAKTKPNIAEYAAKLHKEGYVNYSNTSVKNEKEEPAKMKKPYVIPPEDFGEFDDYEKISLTYYADQILADEDDDPVEDIDDVVGVESLNSFGEYEDDSVFVRNDRLKCDYEILMDQRKYSDVVKERPRGVSG